MTTATLTRRQQSIAELILIRSSAAADLAASFRGRDDEWAVDRRREIDWANGKLSQMGATPEEIRAAMAE